MNDTEVLVLHGSPGAGKSTLARAIAELLRTADIAHAVIDLDELSIVHPYPGRSFALDNLAAMWPRYTAIPRLKVILPTVIVDEAELDRLRAAAPAATLLVAELTAPLSILKERVTAREPNEFWQERLRGFVDLYHRRADLAQIRDFEVGTHGATVRRTAREVVEKAGWARQR